MSKTIKYIGTQTRWPELAVTGKQATWSPGWVDQRIDTEAALLLATGQFFDVDSINQTAAETAAISVLVSADWFSSLQINGGSKDVFRKMFANALAGQRQRLLILGDSTAVGSGAGTNGAGATGLVGARAKNWPTRLAAFLTAAGIPAFNAAAFGTQATESDSVSYNAYDPRVTVTGWTTSGIGTIGSAGWTSTTAGHTWSMNPGMTFDRFDVYTAAAGDISTDIGGASLGTITGTAGVNKTTVSCTRGANTITITKVGTTAVFILGVVPWDSTLGGVDIIQGGRFGGSISSLTGTGSAWSAGNAALLSAIDADITLVEMTINDATTGPTSQAAYAASLATLTAAHIAAGSAVVTSTGIPSSHVSTTDGTLAGYWSSLEASAAANGGLHIRYGARKTYAENNALGWMFDTKHGNAQLYADKAMVLADIMRGLA